jgi:hypothetical protein
VIFVPLDRPSPAQIAALVEELVGLGVSRRRIAQALDVNPSTLHRQITGAVPASWVMVRALERECERARAERARSMPAVVVPIWAVTAAKGAVDPGARGLPVTIDLAEPGKEWVIVEVEIESRTCGIHAGESALVEIGGEYGPGDVLLVGVLGEPPDLRRLEEFGGSRIVVDDRAAYPLDAQSEVEGVVRHALRIASRRV